MQTSNTYTTHQIIQAHLALIAVNLIYGANYIIAKEVTPEYILPFGFTLIRVFCATCLMWALHQLLCQFAETDSLIHKQLSKIDLLKIAGCSIFGVAINQMLFLKGLSMTSPINASLIMITAPIAVLIFAAIIVKERINWQKALGILLGACGAGIIIIFSHNNAGMGGSPSSALGDFLVFANASSYALYLVLIKTLMEKYHPFTILKWVFFFGFFFVLPFSYSEFLVIQWDAFLPTTWMGLVYVVFCATLLTYLFNIFALNRVNASIVGIYIYTQPIIASTIAIALGKDALSSLKILAAALIFMGVFLVSRKTNDGMEKG